MKKLVSIYTMVRRDYEVEAQTNDEAVAIAEKRINDYDDETLEETVMVDGVNYLRFK